MAGLTVTQNDINNTAGDIARALAYQLRRAVNLKRFLDRFTAGDLTTLYGLSTADANLLKSMIGELAAVNATFQAGRVFTDQVAGLGDV